MKIIFSRLGALTLIFATFLSCETNRKSNTPNEITYDIISVSEVYHLQNDSTKPSCTLEISYTFPSAYANAEVLEKMQKELNFLLMEGEKYEKLTPKDAIDQYVKDYIENYKRDAVEQFPDWQETGSKDSYFSYFKALSSIILFDQGGLISYQVTSRDYKGGENYIPSDFESDEVSRTDAVTTYRNIVIDLTNGSAIKEEDIFQSEYKDILNSLLIQEIIKHNKVKDTEDLIMMGYWGIEDLTSNNNFLIDDKGITYIFNPGEFSALKLGEIRVFLPYSDLVNILKDKSPISNILNS
ncbi:MAG: RsiV family protein [Prevotella sp.]|jgi:hypothetical protein|nr:RsiV family protein [Prevotella sp.]